MKKLSRKNVATAALTYIMALIIFHGAAQGQASRFDITQVQTIGTAPPNGSVQLFGIPFAQITLCGYPANAVPCTNFATSYTSATSGIACPAGSPVVLNGTSSCTNVSDAGGNAGFWVLPGNYSYMVTV